MKAIPKNNSNIKNSWHRFIDDSDTVIVFVHGYFSDPTTCWTSEDGTFWPDLIEEDARIPQCSVFIAGYHTTASSGDYGVQDCAIELIGALRRVSATGHKAPLTKQRIIFVCHSLGGIVIRYVLDAFRDDFKDKNIGLCLMASPSLGSDYADRFGLVSSILKNKTGRQLQFFNPFLQDLDGRFIRFLDSRSEGTFAGAEAIEHKFPFLPQIPWFKPIVSKLSAGRYFSQRETLPGTNHSSIVKPSDINHPSHTFLIDFLTNIGFTTRNQQITMPNSSRAAPAAIDVLFDVYEPRLEPFYVVRNLDTELTKYASLQCIWISGHSGTGKTCALKRQITQQRGRHFHVCLSLHGNDATRDALIRELGETFAEIAGGDAPNGYGSLVSFLLRQDAEEIVIYVDEVSSSEASEELLILLYDMLITWKQKTGNRRLLLVVSSLEEPGKNRVPNKEKLHELFAFAHSSCWSNEELESLCQRILETLRELKITKEELEQIIGEAHGSPRFIKMFFRSLLFQTVPNVSIALKRATEQLVK